MTALHFGSSDSPLFGVYHPALIREPRAPAILLLNPFGVEAIRANRIFRLLAEKLARAGSPVLRFDYFGTGDSAGACHEFSMMQALQDIKLAHQELLDLSGAKRVVWIGLRLGAALAVQAIQSEKQKSLRGLVLWDLISDGSSYWDELQEAHYSELARAYDKPLNTIKKSATDSTSEILGIEVSQEFISELTEFDFPEVVGTSIKYLSTISNNLDGDLAQEFKKISANVHHHEEPAASDWNSDETLNAFTVPVKTLDIIKSAVEGMR